MSATHVQVAIRASEPVQMLADIDIERWQLREPFQIARHIFESAVIAPIPRWWSAY
jgi:hypothetical protein